MPETKLAARREVSLPGDADFRRRFLLAELPPAGGEPHPEKMDSIIRIYRFFQIVRKAK